jgi:uncharacterized protein involved in type VI secretion and phage assembly
MDFETEEQILALLRSRYFGKYRGVVADNADPTARGRLQVRVPAVLGELAVWAMPCVPYAGAGVGFYCLPEPEAGVWVEFEAGDPSFPIWVGCFWADDELPDENDAAIKVLRTEATTLRIDDGEQIVLVSTDAGAELELSDEVRSEAGGAKVTVGSNAVSSTGGSASVDVGPSAVRANDGAWEVS